jgi:hypothetical protein
MLRKGRQMLLLTAAETVMMQQRQVVAEGAGLGSK